MLPFLPFLIASKLSLSFSISNTFNIKTSNRASFVFVSGDSFDGLLVDYMRRKKAGVIVKGLRAVSDFEYEYQMALTNHRLNPDVETLFLNTSQEYMFLSSSIVKQIASFDGDVSDFLPEQIRDDVQQRLRKGN